MLAVVLEEDQHSRDVMCSMLSSLGYSTVLPALDLEEAEFFFRKEKDRVKLILASLSSEDAFDLPLSRLVIKEPTLDQAPLILTLNSRLVYQAPFAKERMSRIDGHLSKPFGHQQIRAAVASAYQRRARIRSTLVAVSQRPAVVLNEAILHAGAGSHWKEVVWVDSIEELSKKIEERRFLVGGILIDPEFTEARNWITPFKKTSLGSTTPTALLSHVPEKTRDYRLGADLFFRVPRLQEMSPDEWQEIADRLAKRLLHAWEARSLITDGRIAVKQDNKKKIQAIAKAGMALDPDRWEFLELAAIASKKEGKTAEAVQHLRKALHTQPCAPSVHLQLLDLLQGQELADALRTAQDFCPAHPQIRDHATKN